MRDALAVTHTSSQSQMSSHSQVTWENESDKISVNFSMCAGTIGLLKDLCGSLEITARSEEKRKCEGMNKLNTQTHGYLCCTAPPTLSPPPPTHTHSHTDEDSPPLYTVNSCAVSSPPPRETKLPSHSMVAYEDMTAKSSPRMRGNPPRSAPLVSKCAVPCLIPRSRKLDWE